MRIIGGKYIDLGSDVTILHNLRIEAVENSGKIPHIKIGDRVNIEQNVHITCGERIEIGRDVSILAETMITDIIHPYEDVSAAPKYQPIKTNPVFIGEQTMIGMGAKIMPGVNIGKHCVIGTNAVVTGNIPDYCVAVGIPARIIKRYNEGSGKWESLNQCSEK